MIIDSEETVKPVEETTQANEEVKPEVEENDVHKQCELAAIEATRRADEILRRRGLIVDTVPQEEEEEKKKNEEEEKKEEKKEEEVTPITYELPKTLQEKITKDTKTGPLSWYKSYD